MHSTCPLFNNFSNTFLGHRTLMNSITPPPKLNGDSNHNRRWNAAIIAMAACDAHRDGGFLTSDRGFHPLTVVHYSSGINTMLNKAAQIAHSKARKEHLNDIRQLIYDLATTLDRLSGGSTVILHYSGVTPPYADVIPEHLSIDAYLNPRALAEHPKLHQVGASLAQTFVEEWALPIARAFRDHRAQHNWKQEPATRIHRQMDFTALPLIPCPARPLSCSFVFPGRPPLQLAQMLASGNAISYIP
ncbi:hypothetical protein J3R83DRAFT_4096 [Lanmaoa asiatica]|nr:hypothetical protein J3R83DRAFT_4087 [Lanmaoa asiatica]KAH0827427.1 hypothetical protein J3R83DRAFT_4096 [Lanmaoa asiatica]